MYTRAEMLIMLATGLVIGGYVTARWNAHDYNKLVDKCNLSLERERIQRRVFKEIMPQLPDDYNLSEQTMIDIKSYNMFADNDLI